MSKVLNNFAKQSFKKFLKNEYEKACKENDCNYRKFLEILKDQEKEVFANDKTQNKKNILEAISKFEAKKPKKEISDFKITENYQTTSKNKEDKIGKIEANSFRGIYKLNLDLSNKNYTFFYAPNGCGKTSVSEVLEYATTGDTAERRKRNKEPKNYFQNIYTTEEFEVSLLNQNNQDFNKDKWYEKCFIEKNRIEKFAHLSVLRRDKMNEAIAKLFPNLEDFFILIEKKFINYDRFKINSGKWKEWNNLPNIENKSEEIEDAFENIKEIVGIDKKLNIQDIKLIEDYFGDLIKEKEEKLEAIKNINLEDNLPSVNINKIKKKIDNARNLIDSIKGLKKEIGENALEANLLELYEKSKKYFETLDDDLEKCPLCNTESTKWEESPIKLTNENIIRLKKIKEKKNKIIDKRKKLKDNLSTIKDQFFLIKKGKNNLEKPKLKGYINKKELKEIDFDVVEKIRDVSYKENSLEKIEDILSDFDKDNFKHYEVIIERIKEKICKFKKKIDKEKETKKVLEKEREVINDNLRVIKKNKKEIKGLKKEKSKYKKAEEIRKTYEKFYDNLRKFNQEKIKEELKNIEDLIVTIYNYLNQDDLEEEKLKDIMISPNNGVINIKLKNKPEVDSLNILSEGHIKLLGLSILFARAVRDKIPFMVMDDVVNAIDIDHRSNIASFLFNYSGGEIGNFIHNVQLILFTHDRFFDERICNEYVSNSYNYDHYILLKSYSEKEGNSFVHVTPSKRNYIKKIKESIEEGYDVRTALFYTRLTLEDRVRILCKQLSITDIEGKFRKTSRGIEFSKTEKIEDLFKKVKKAIKKKKNDKNLKDKLREKYCNLYNSVVDIRAKVACDKVLELIHKEAHAGSLDYFQIRIPAGGIKGTEIKEILEKIEQLDQNIKELGNEVKSNDKKMNY